MSPEKFYSIEYRREDGYLYAYVEGKTDSFEISRLYWTEIAAECQRSNVSRVLIEENIEENVSSSDMYNFALELPKIIGNGIVVAFVDRQAEHQDLNRFGALVANNRGLRSQVFNSKTEAESWLLSS